MRSVFGTVRAARVDTNIHSWEQLWHHANAERPVIARPTMSDCTVSVPS
jgi:hypothetical protein